MKWYRRFPIFVLCLTSSLLPSKFQAKALRQERDKAVKRKELSQTNNVRLSYDDSSRQFVVAGEDRNEVNRILHDLGKLTQKQDDTSRTSSPVPFPSPLPSRPLEMDDVLENINLSLPKKSTL